MADAGVGHCSGQQLGVLPRDLRQCLALQGRIRGLGGGVVDLIRDYLVVHLTCQLMAPGVLVHHTQIELGIGVVGVDLQRAGRRM